MSEHKLCDCAEDCSCQRWVRSEDAEKLEKELKAVRLEITPFYEALADITQILRDQGVGVSIGDVGLPRLIRAMHESASAIIGEQGDGTGHTGEDEDVVA